MKKVLLLSLIGFGVMTMLVPSESFAQRHRPVVVRHRPVARRPVVARTRLVVHPRYPIRRALPASVLVRPARRAVVVGTPLVYLPALGWRATTVATIPRERLVWEDSETIDREEGWVDSNFGIDSDGNALFLQINGNADLNFAEVTFANGNVQVVDFNGRTHGSGIYNLLDFADGRRVKTVRLLARSESDETKLAIYLSK